MKNSAFRLEALRNGALALCLIATAPLARAAESAASFGSERPSARIAPHASRVDTWTINASPEKIFPLLCPTREYDWIPSWRAQMVHSVSGAAEEGCIFQTRLGLDGLLTWVCTRFEPPSRIDYTCYSETGMVVRLKIALTRTNDDTLMVWERTWHATSASGRDYIEHWKTSDWDAIMARLRAELECYLRTGEALAAEKH